MTMILPCILAIIGMALVSWGVTMGQPAWRVSSNWDHNGYIALKWTNSRGYIQMGPVFLTVRDARAYIDSKGN
jgi:hypothetical protein